MVSTLPIETLFVPRLALVAVGAPDDVDRGLRGATERPRGGAV